MICLAVILFLSIFGKSVFAGLEWGIIAFAQLVLSLVVIIVNRAFFVNGFISLINRAPNMDSLVMLGSGIAFLWSLCLLLADLGGEKLNTVFSDSLYFESSAMILTLVTLGKFLEAGAKNKSGKAINLLVEMHPDTVWVIRDGEELRVKESAVRVGEIAVLYPGEIAAFDGTVLEGDARINQSAVTGESQLVPVRKGDKIISGTTSMGSLSKTFANPNLDDSKLLYRVETVGADTSLARIISLVEEASNSKAPISRLADKISGIFVPSVMALAVVVFAIWLIASGEIDLALNMAVSVLLISCPCALGLATPLAIMIASGKGAQQGIIIKNGEILEKLKDIDLVVFDKTGTLTEGAPLDEEHKDSLKDSAKATVSALKEMGIKTVMLSGDKKEIAEEIANKAGLDDYVAEVLPDGKEAVIRSYQEQSYTVSMVGDGINDAPALVRSNIGMAIGNGTDIAIESADVILLNNSLFSVVNAIKLGKDTVKNIKRSLFWAFFYNIICIPVAAGVLYPAFGILLNPMIAAAAMSFSSLSVVLNALSLWRKNGK
ncbi:MAG: HAD-IC family P-type ATPase [Clostridia bacterium]|nr:HAD-IC family P-type ATPase [Clostridia bacterium]